MRRIAKINIGLLGGRGYGKTVFLTKLISLADSSKDGFLQFDAGSESLQIKNLMLTNDGRLPATTIKEFSKYNFILGTQADEKWKIQFADYAGELLERIDTTSSSHAATLSKNESAQGDDASNQDSYVANEGNRRQIKTVKKWLRKCDAVIVLMPKDITDKEKYKLGEINIFRQNIGLLLKIMQDDPILKNRPVCMAINKWDLGSCEESFDEVISSAPFAAFKQQLSNLCGSHLFCMPISAFGQHLENEPDKADPNGKPFQVSELLLQLAHRAEYARVGAVKNALKQLPAWIGWPLIPFILVKNTIAGITNPRLTLLNQLLLKKYGRRFAVNGTAFLLCLALVVSSMCTTLLWMEYKGIERKIANGFNSSLGLVQVENTLAKPRMFNFMFGKSALLGVNRYDIMERFNNAKTNYNRNILNAVKICIDERKADINNNALDPQIRQQRIDEIKRELASATNALTADALERVELHRLEQEMTVLTDRTNENKPFDIAYQNWHNIRDDYEKANSAVVFLKEYTMAKYPERKSHLDIVESAKKEIENRKYNDLYAAIHEKSYEDDFNENTNDYPARIKRSNERKSGIQSEMRKLPFTSRIDELKKLERDEDIRIAYLEKYGHFDVDVERLLLRSGSGAIAAIQAFIAENKNSYSDKRNASFDKLDNRIQALNNAFFAELEKNISKPECQPDSTAKYEEQIQRAQQRIAFIQAAIKEITDPALIARCNDMRRNDEALIAERQLYGPFEIAYRKLESLPAKGKVAEIDKFISKFPQSEYSDKKTSYGILSDLKKNLSDQFYAELEGRFPSRRPEANWREQQRIAESTVSLIKEYQKEFAPNTEQWKKCETRAQQENDYIKQLQFNGKFDDAYNELLAAAKDDTYIRAIISFCTGYNAATYPDRKGKINELLVEANSRENTLFAELTKPVTTQGMPWKDKVASYQKSNEAITLRSKSFRDDSEYLSKLAEYQKTQESEIKKEQLYGPFDDEWSVITKRLDTLSDAEQIAALDKFLRAYDKKTYPSRDAILSNAQAKLDAVDAKVREATIKLLSDDKNSDSDLLTWDTKIARAARRIELCNDGIAKLSLNSKYRKELANRITSDQKLIQDINAYKDYYKAYAEVEHKSDIYKISAINVFLLKYQNQYPQPLPRYTIERLLEAQKELRNQFEKEMADKLESAKDNESDAWAIRRRKAKERLEAYNSFEITNAIAMPKETAKETQFIELCNSHISFENALALIKKEHASEKDFFEAIYRFYSEYPDTIWLSSREADYKGVRALEADRVKKLHDLLSDELKKHQDFSTVESSLLSYRRQLSATNNSKNNYLEQMNEYKRLSSLIKDVEQNIAAIEQVKIDQKRIADLLAEAGKLSSGRIDAIGTFLVGVSKLIEELPEKKVHTLIQEQYGALIKSRDSWNASLYGRMKHELSSYEQALTEELSDEEKNKQYDQILLVRNKYLGLFSPESSQFDLAKREYENSSKSQERLKKEQAIKDAISLVYSDLKDASKNTSSKLQSIKNFSTKMKAIGKEDDFPRFRTEFAHISAMNNVLEWDQSFAELNGKIQQTINTPPSDDAEEKIEKYIKSCEELIKSLRPFIENNGTKDAANAVRIELDKRKDENISIREEWELFNSVKDANQKFYASPADSTYDAVTDAIWTLRQHEYKNKAHTKEVSELETTLKAFNEARTDIDSKFEEFKRVKKASSLDLFIKSARAYIEKGGKNPQTEYANKILNPALWDKRITVTLQTYNFNNSGFESWGIDVDFKAKISGLMTPMEYDIPDIKGDNKNNPSHTFLSNRIGTDQIAKQGFASIQNSITVEFGNYNFSNDIGSQSIEFARVLAESMTSGECVINFSSTSRRQPKKGSGSVSLKFSGLPRF